MEIPHLPARPSAASWPRFVLLALLGGLWAVVFNELRLDWSTNPQYSYGWIVPLLAAYLFWARWPARPAPAAPSWPPWLVATAVLLALLFLPVRLIGEAAPEWSAVRWALTLEVLSFSLLALYGVAGRATVRHFAWPLCFVLVAVAWPVHLEEWVTQSLMRCLAAITAELLSWGGLAAVAHGNLIQLSHGVVGVDEACSGVRSLQSMLMASLFLGELNRFSSLGRVRLVATGLALALLFNLIRALLLAGVATRDGVAAIARWHDPAGFSILLVSFAVLCLLMRLLGPRDAAPVVPTAAPAPWRSVPRRALIALAAWLVLAEAATEGWYRSHEAGARQPPAWSVRWPETRPNFEEHPISAQVSKLLAFNEGRQVSWDEPEGSHWQMFVFRWNPGRSSTISARQHRPEVCLPASGRTLVAELPETVVRAGPTAIPFRSYQFSKQGAPFYVFFCLAESGNRDLTASGASQILSPLSRLERVRIGQRNLGQQSAEIIVEGLSSPGEAVAALQRQAPDLFQSAAPAPSQTRRVNAN